MLIHPRAATAGLAALALFVLYGSSGALAGGAPRVEPLPGISLPDIAQNVLLYIPFGMLGVWAFRGSVPDDGRQYLSIVALAFVYSSAMELLQMRFAARIASPLDVISNVSGALHRRNGRRANRAGVGNGESTAPAEPACCRRPHDTCSRHCSRRS